MSTCEINRLRVCKLVSLCRTCQRFLLVMLVMTGWPYGYAVTYNTSGIMGLLTLAAVIALVIIDHALEDTLAQRYA
jgi:hypothetical protein